MPRNTIDARGRWILAATILASGMSFLAGSTVTIALPTIQESFDTSLTGLQWTVNAYLLAIGSLLLLGGALADRYGQRRVFMVGIAVFTVGSLISAMAGSIIQLAVFQAVQGIGAALMIPTSLTIINNCFATRVRGRAIGLWSGFSAGLASTGPFIGGWLTETFGWPAVFLLNVPLGIMTFLAAWRFVPSSEIQRKERLDWSGALMLLGGFFGISFGFIQASDFGWGNMYVLISFAAGVVFGILFVLHEIRHKSPLVPLDIFKKRHVAVANIMTLHIYFALLGMTFFLSIILQQAYDYSPTMAGLAILPVILTITFGSGPSGSLADRIGERKPMIAGPMVVAVGFGSFLLTRPESSYWVNFLPGLLLIGAGMALVIPALTKSALMVEKEKTGAASGINNSASRVANLMAIAVLGSIALAVFSGVLEDNLTERDVPGKIRSSIVEQADELGGVTVPEGIKEETANRAERAIDESLVASFHWVMGIASGLSLIAGLIALGAMRVPEGEE